MKNCISDKDVDMDKLIDFLLSYASLQTSIGVQTSRIVNNSTRIAKSFGCDVTVMMFQRNVSISLSKLCDVDGVKKCRHITALVHHRAKPINFNLNAELNKLSWFAHKQRPSLEELQHRFDELNKLKPLNRYVMLFMISLATAAFCKIFGGDNMSSVFVFISTLCGFYVKQEMNRHHAYIYGTTVASSFVASFVVGLFLKFTTISNTPEIALGTSILFLVPGVPFINSIVDLFDGYILNGMSRLINALLILISMTIGITTTLIILDLSLK